MRDRAAFWPPAPAPGAALRGDGLIVRVLPAVPQLMVSGDLDAFCAAQTLSAPVGLLGQVDDTRYALRLARNRMLAVGLTADHAAAGWQDGIATTPMTGALAVLHIGGANAMELFVRATAIDPRAPGPSAALLFAGQIAALCRDPQGLRLHIDRGLTAFVLDWIAATGLAAYSE